MQNLTGAKQLICEVKRKIFFIHADSMRITNYFYSEKHLTDCRFFKKK